ncbi:hypothetical protein [Pandoraea sp. NPDC087047]|uniref:hypothetical protein n=1 Tax=Pandoraea sp. NPDC087047 TaxID=3364390 RepID=UPI00380A4A1A
MHIYLHGQYLRLQRGKELTTGLVEIGQAQKAYLAIPLIWHQPMCRVIGFGTAMVSSFGNLLVKIFLTTIRQISQFVRNSEVRSPAQPVIG